MRTNTQTTTAAVHAPLRKWSRFYETCTKQTGFKSTDNRKQDNDNKLTPVMLVISSKTGVIFHRYAIKCLQGRRGTLIKPKVKIGNLTVKTPSSEFDEIQTKEASSLPDRKYPAHGKTC